MTITWKSKRKEWMLRYVPAEVISFLLTMLGALAAYRWSGSRIAAALWATWSGNAGYFGYIIVSDIVLAHKCLSATGKKYSLQTLWRNVRALIVEFGAAELLDSFIIRPALMYYLPLLTGNFTAGIIAAKFAADITFYVPAIISYEFSKSRFSKFD